MSTVARLRGGVLTPFDWSSLSRLPFFAPAIRIEDFLEGDRYVVRAELPGVDPAKDITISYADGVLTLDVERGETHHDRLHAEFLYGSFSRTITLPPGAKEETISASYTDGILEITVRVAAPAAIAKHIPVVVGNGVKD